MLILVTGSAGFIGSHTCQALLNTGHQVRGIDCLVNYYPEIIKKANLSLLAANPDFEFWEQDLAQANMADLLNGVYGVIHLAAQAGVRNSWGTSFDEYTYHNITTIQRLLEALKEYRCPLVFASSSSVYGNAEQFPTSEDSPCQPVSPYGMTKLAGESLCSLYYKNFNLPISILRYFTVYGPRQRPDMAFHKFIKAILLNEEITLLGDGSQIRDFTYVDDIVNATVTALFTREALGQIFNLGGGVKARITEVISLLEQKMATKARVRYLPTAKGDVKQTFADTNKARSVLNFQPKFTLEQGLEREIDWVRQNLNLLLKAGPCSA